jgi:hypothetical protein
MDEMNGLVMPTKQYSKWETNNLPMVLPPPTGKPLELADDINIAISLLNENTELIKMLMAITNSIIESMNNIVSTPKKRRWTIRVFNGVLFIGMICAIVACAVVVADIIPNWIRK